MGFSPSAAKATIVHKGRNARAAFKSWDAFKQWIVVEDTALDQHGNEGSSLTWSNVDLDPTPPERRTWAWWNCESIDTGVII